MPYRIIVADHSLSVRKILEAAFSSPEFDVRFFENGDELVSELGNLKFDAVLLNIFIPGKDGLEIAKLLRERKNFHSVPMIFLKGAFDSLDAGRLSGLKYDGIYTEPFDSEALVCYVKELIENRKDPETLPEELPAPPEAKNGFDWPLDIEDKIEKIIDKKIPELEKKIEKRIRTSILKENDHE